MKVRWGIWLGIALAATLASTAIAKQRITHDLSTVISGAIDIDAAGQPIKVEIDYPDLLNAEILEYVQRKVSTWTFHPVIEDGAPIPFRTRMNLRLALKPVGDAFVIRVPGVVFIDPTPPEPTNPPEEWPQLQPARYPPAAFRTGVSGIVYLALQVNASGQVQNAIAEQVNLAVTGSASSVKKWRELLASASIEAAKNWKFTPPGRTPEGEEFWTMRTLMTYTLGPPNMGPRDPPPAIPGTTYGQWTPYFPAPVTPIPWPRDADPPGFTPDAKGPTGKRPDDSDPTGHAYPPRLFETRPRARLLGIDPGLDEI